MRVLYLSYDGALDPLGASQVLPYVEGLTERGHQFDLLTYEKPERSAESGQVNAMHARLAERGIGWHPLPYHRRPPALGTALDLRRGLAKARELHTSRDFDLVHVRSYPCATIAISLKRAHGIPYVFDMRGFYPEERVDGGLWSARGPLYSLTKRLEADFLREASAVVTLTQASVPVLSEQMDRVGAHAAVDVVPTAVDLDRFTVSEPEDPPRVVYLGSVGTWYRTDVMVQLAKAWLELRPTLVVDFVINGDPQVLRPALSDVPPNVRDRIHLRSVEHDEVPTVLAGALATFAVIDPAPSKVASAPTKVGESLASGLPVLTNRGVGDVAAWVEAEAVGTVLEGFGPVECTAAASAHLKIAEAKGVRERCRAFAERTLSLENAVSKYDMIYRNVMDSLIANRNNTRT